MLFYIFLCYFAVKLFIIIPKTAVVTIHKSTTLVISLLRNVTFISITDMDVKLLKLCI